MIESFSRLNPSPPLCYLKSDFLVYNLTSKSNAIGRSPEQNIVLNHPSISKEHARIEIDNNNNLYLVDLNSINGTFLNEQKIPSNQLIKIKESDKIQFGKDPTIYTIVFDLNNNQSQRPKTKITRYPIQDNKISLVNNESYQLSKVDHFAKSQSQKNKIEKLNTANEFPIINNHNTYEIKEDIHLSDNIINEEDNEGETLKEIENEEYNANLNPLNNNLLQNNSSSRQQQSSLYQEIYKKNTALDVKLKEKSTELSNISSLYEQLNDKYNKLSAKHNALMIYASDIQKKNDLLELLLKQKETQFTTLSNQDITKQLQEKNVLISHLQGENEVYKAEIEKIKKTLLSEHSNNFTLSENLNKLTNDYLQEIMKYKQIVAKYLAFEKECNQKWNELINTNESLNNKVMRMKKEWDNDLNKYNDIIENYDKRMSCALAQIPKNYDKFNVKKEEAAKFLVEQMTIYMKEKTTLLKENSQLNKKVTELSFENEKLKDEILKNELKLNNNDINALKNKNEELEDIIRKYKEIYNPEKIIDYENLILRMDMANKEKDKLINDYKTKMEEIMKNKTFLNFDDREVVSSISNVLKEKDQVIKTLKEKLIDFSSGNIKNLDALNVNNLNNKENNEQNSINN